MLPDITFLHQLADTAAKETLPRFRSSVAVDNKLSHDFDPVTEGDRAAEAAIRDMIESRFPDHGILGEEHGSSGLDRKYVWVIDPIDGTRSFIAGVPLWGTLIGLYERGRAVMGVMDQPFTKERYIADGKTTRLFRPEGEQKLKTSACEKLENAIMFTTSPRIIEGGALKRYDQLESRVKLARYGADCYAFSLVAAGHADIAVESGLQPYDIAALIPLIEQAGGIITNWNGGRPEQGGDIIAAATSDLHAAALRILNG